MFLPAIPDFPLLFKKTFPCPVCGGGIATRTVEDNFACPICHKKLSSNIENAWRSGAITGTLIYLALTITLYFFSDEILYIFILKLIGYGFGGIFAIYAGHYTYRYKVKIWTREN
jgi:hypothetical protein